MGSVYHRRDHYNRGFDSALLARLESSRAEQVENDATEQKRPDAKVFAHSASVEAKRSVV